MKQLTLDTRSSAPTLSANSRISSLDPANKQSVFALVSAGFGITFATADQAEAGFAGVVFKRIDDPDDSVEMSLAWLPELEDPDVGRFVAFLRDEARLLRTCSVCISG